MIDHSPPVIQFACDADCDAERVAALLDALGYKPVRLRPDSTPRARQLHALTAMRKRFKLSPRESEVLVGIVEGHHNRQIADVLGLARATVKWHVRNICGKMQCKNTTQVLCMFARELAGEA